MASSRPWPFNDDEDRPSGSVRPLSQAELHAILAHLSDDPDVSEHLVEVARVRQPAAGRAGSVGSGQFAAFNGTFPRGTLNFTRGTYVELKLSGQLDGQPTGLIELPVNWIIDDSPMYGAVGDFPSPRMITKAFRDDFDVAYKEGTMFMLTMHPHMMGQRSRIRHLEELIVYMKSKPGVWFATAEEIAKYIKQQSGIAGTASKP